MPFTEQLSSQLTNLLAELNHTLGGPFFKISMHLSYNTYFSKRPFYRYSLDLTKQGLTEKKWLLDLTTPEGCGYLHNDMIHFITGVIAGAKVILSRKLND